ncbi:MAG: HepT-like ribonuclease domain-containing protein [Nocardioides sp.]
MPWGDIAGMRDFLAHHYFATSPEIMQAVVDKDLKPLADAVQRIRASLPARE